MKKLLGIILCLTMMTTLVPLTSLAEGDDWVTLRVECYERSIAGYNVEDCMQLHYIQEHFGDPNHIKIEFVPVSRWEEGTILTTQLAGGTAPDLCITYGTNLVMQYVEMGGILPLDDLLAEYGHNLTAFLGDDVLEYGQLDIGDGKKQYYLCARRAISASQTAIIRGDWLEALNMAVPTTTDELYDYLVAAKENKLGGEDTIPFSCDLYEPDPLYGWIIQMDAAINYDEVTEEDWFAYAGFHELLPGAKEAFRFMNKLFNEGLVSEYFGVDNGDQMEADRIAGKCGFWVGNYDAPWLAHLPYQQEMAQNIPDAYWMAANCYSNLYGDTLHDTGTAVGQNIFIPAWVSDEVAAAAVKYLDWMSLPENMFFLQNGVEGVNYSSVNEDGVPLDAKGISDVPDEYKMHGGDVCFIVNGAYYGSTELNARAIALGFPGYEDRVTDSMLTACTDGYSSISFTIPIQAEADYGATVTSKEAEFLVNVIRCPEDAFDATYEEYTQAILTSGGSMIIDEQRAAYNDGNVRGAYPYADKVR